MDNTTNDNEKTTIFNNFSDEQIRNLSTSDLIIMIFEELQELRKDHPNIYEYYKDELRDCLDDKNIFGISITDHPSGRKGLTVEGAMFHVKGKYLRQYFDAASDVVNYIMYPHTNKKQALASALEIQDHVLGELYERSQSHNF